jgi:hypothetical protein
MPLGSSPFVSKQKRPAEKPVFFYFLVPLTGIEPVRELPPERF